MCSNIVEGIFPVMADCQPHPDIHNDNCLVISCIILKFHRALLCPLITTKIERIPPFEKGGPGGISEAIHLKNPPRSPFFKGGSIIFIYGVIEFKKDTKNVLCAHCLYPITYSVLEKE